MFKNIIKSMIEYFLENLIKGVITGFNPKNSKDYLKIDECLHKTSKIEMDLLMLKKEIEKIKLIFYVLSFITILNFFIVIYLIIK